VRNEGVHNRQGTQPECAVRKRVLSVGSQAHGRGVWVTGSAPVAC
jgi:hypothetical protein